MGLIFKSGLLLLSSVFFIFSFLNNDINLLFISLITLYLFCLVFAIEKIHQRVVYLFFLVTFFVFLMGNYTYLFFSQINWWEPFSQETTKYTIYYLMLSLLSITMGFSLSGIFRKRNNNKSLNFEDKDLMFNNSLRKVCKIIFWITCIPTFYLLIDKTIYSHIYGYTELYLSYTGGPLILQKLQLINLLSFYMFLATMPTKRESKWIIIIYLLSGILTIFAGARTTAVTSILIVLYYLQYRNNYDRKYLSGDSWLSKKIIILIIILFPITIIFLSFWGYYRVNYSMSNITLGDLFFGFFRAQGGSVNIISYVQELKFPSTNLSYTFGPLINFFKYNIFSNLIFDFQNYVPQTIGAALYGNNMSYTITYLVMPHNYFAGIGMGSCYIAELLCDFGFWGVIVFNIILGTVLSMFNNINPKKPWVFTLLLLMLSSLLNLPRDVTLDWFVNSINITTIGSILTFYFLAKLLSNRDVVKKNEIGISNNRRVFSLSK